LASLLVAGSVAVVDTDQPADATMDSGRLSGPTRNSARTRQGVERSSAVSPNYLFRSHSAGYWEWRLRQRTRQLRTALVRFKVLRRHIVHRPETVEAINLACVVYGSCSTLWRKAACETGGTFSPVAYNPSGASGLFQFLPSTWRSTPFGRFSIWSPYANALAAGWMHAQGRGSEWACR
jgi:hypothetical protein